jgi:glycerol transport system ATP-binding protein
MELKLEHIEHRVGPATHLYPLDLNLVPRAVTVLLGATQAGKTTLMRVMAGLDRPSSGRVVADGVDVTGVAVRERNVAMVYQQFINYPSLTVADNIASPLKLRGEQGASWPRSCTSSPFSIAFRPSCPAASSSAWRWRVRWPRKRR